MPLSVAPIATMPGTVPAFTAWRSTWSTCPSAGLSPGSATAGPADDGFIAPAIEDAAASVVSDFNTSRRFWLLDLIDFLPGCFSSLTALFGGALSKGATELPVKRKSKSRKQDLGRQNRAPACVKDRTIAFHLM